MPLPLLCLVMFSRRSAMAPISGCLMMSSLVSCMMVMPFSPCRALAHVARSPVYMSLWLVSPQIIILLLSPSLVRSIFI